MGARAPLTAVFAGGMLGVLLRAGLAEVLPHDAGGWPWATLAANLAGSLVLGWLIVRPTIGARGRASSAFVGPGLCGALTTFSTFQLEIVQLAEAGRLALAVLYAAVSIGGGLLAVLAGGALGREGAQ